MSAVGREDGFSLLELVAVLAIYSVIAVLSLQLLSNAALSRTQISENSNAVAEVTAVAAVLRRDLEFMSPGADAAPPRFGPGSLAISRSVGSATVAVEWRVEGRTLYRITQTGRQQMLEDVAGFDARISGPSGGWISAASSSPTRPGDLPSGIEVTVQLGSVGEVRVVVAR